MDSKYPKVMSGARAKVGYVDPATNETKFVGIYTNVSYGVVYDTQAAYILGRYSPADVDYVAAELVNLTCSGWRVINYGPHTTGKIPRLSDLLAHQYLTFVVADRLLETQKPSGAIATIRKVRPTGFTTTISNRQLEEMTMTYVGILCDDEDTQNEENALSTDLP